MTPIREILGRSPEWASRSLADLALSLICDQCRARPTHIVLGANALVGSPIDGDKLCWAIPLIVPLSDP